MSRLRDLAVSFAVLVAGRGRGRRRRKPGRLVAEAPRNPGSELAVAVLLLCASLCAVAFPIFYALDLTRLTQLLGTSLGFAFLFLAAALILTAKRLVPDEDLEEEYSEASPHDQAAVAEIIEEGGSGFTRKKLLGAAAALAGGTLGVALVTPAVSMGPIFDTRPLYDTPWRRGRRLVDDEGKPYAADDIEPQTFYTAFPEGADRERVGSPLVVIRLPPDDLELPPGRQDWAPEGILAFSKICTHAGCAVSMYRVPLFLPTDPKPALICPCHYSTFDPATGGTLKFGPAGRPLPQLPLMIDDAGNLRAAANFDQPVGPAWWGVRMGKPT